MCKNALKIVAFEAMGLCFLDSRHVNVKGAGKFVHLIFICDVPPLNPLPRPWCFPKKGEAGFYAGVMEKTADRDATSHLGPPIPRYEFFDNSLQRNSVQWIAGMGQAHDRVVKDIGLMVEDECVIAIAETWSH